MVVSRFGISLPCRSSAIRFGVVRSGSAKITANAAAPAPSSTRRLVIAASRVRGHGHCP
jgi:hypothetical protein